MANQTTLAIEQGGSSDLADLNAVGDNNSLIHSKLCNQSALEGIAVDDAMGIE
ncbi:hypothetical protein [Tepidimonas sp.]|uniref:hypothetical protein n=1 Tax=Tepidimonas sp. TaxID=2002775 RepID=UPI0026065147|nr:hypothetical protein [Tepidimonas sp.]